jgi:hypothetical protein
MLEGMQEGWTQSLERLADYMAKAVQQTSTKTKRKP